MTEPSSHPAHHAARVTARVRFLSRLNRVRSLLATKWWIPMLALLVGVAIQAALHFLAPPVFTSTGRMIVNIRLSIPEGSVYTEELSNFLGTQTALMQSAEVLNRAAARSGLEEQESLDTIKLRVSVQPKTTIFVLSASGSNPQHVQRFLQACMEEYIALKREMREQTSDTTLAGLTEELRQLQKELRKADDELAAFQGSNSVSVLEEQGNSAAGFLIQLNQRLATLKGEHELLQSLTLEQSLEREEQVMGNLAFQEVNRAPGSAAEMDYFRAWQGILLLKAEQEDLAQYLREKHPKMVALKEEIGRRERLLEIYREQSREQMESRKTSLALQIGNLEKDVKEWEARAVEVSRRSAEFQRLKANGSRVQALHDRLLATMQTLDVNKDINPESVTMMEKASPGVENRPTMLRRLGVGAALGLVVGVMILFLVDRLDDRVCSVAELEEVFEEPVLTQIPREGWRGSGLGLGWEESGPGLVEACRSLRSALTLGKGEGGGARVLVVTSSIPGEGKSFTACHLARALAQGGRSVLLVDGDLRRGVLHERLEGAGNAGKGKGGRAAEVSPGLAEVLGGKVHWLEGIRGAGGGVEFLARGEARSGCAELLDPGFLKGLLGEMAARFDFVVVDTPPVMAADEAACLGALADGVLFVFRAEMTSARVAQAALDVLYQRRVKVLGLVFNGVRGSGADYYYYRYREAYGR